MRKKAFVLLNELGYTKQDIKLENLVEAKAKPETKQSFVYEIPKKFSFSQIASYEKCPLQYKYSNILKIPTFGNHYFTFGTIIHNTLQKFLEESFQINNVVQHDLFSNLKTEKKKSTLPLEDLWRIYDDIWFDDWFQDEVQKTAYYKKGKNLLKTFYADFNTQQPDVKFLELPFKLMVGNYAFMGRIDRVDNSTDKGVEIIDYKTGQAKDEKLTADDKRQLLFYQIAAEEALKLKVNQMTYHYLEENKKISFLGQEKDKLKLKENFIEDIENIKAQKFDPTPSPLFVAL